MRRAGATYEEIASAGGGIASTVAKTAAASDRRSCWPARGGALDALMAGGCTTVEVKTGYGLDVDSELRLLRCAAELGERGGADRPDPARAPRAPRRPEGSPRPLSRRDHRQADARAPRKTGATHRRCLLRHHRLHPRGGRAVVQGRRGARAQVRLHAEQLSNQKGAALAAQYAPCRPIISNISTRRAPRRWPPRAPSRCSFPPLITRSRKRKSRRSTCCASTRCRWRSRPIATPAPRLCCRRPCAMNMACTLFGLTPEEALAGMTVNAARALGLEKDARHDRAGKAADLAVWESRAWPNSDTGSAFRDPRAAYSAEWTPRRAALSCRQGSPRPCRRSRSWGAFPPRLSIKCARLSRRSPRPRAALRRRHNGRIAAGVNHAAGVARSGNKRFRARPSSAVRRGRELIVGNFRKRSAP